MDDLNRKCTDIRYDEFDRLIWVSQPPQTPTSQPENLPRAEEHEYDKVGNLKATSTPRATSVSPAMNKTEYDYDNVDRRTKVKKHLGANTIVWETQYDDTTNTRKEIDPLGESVEYQHDPLDRLRYVRLALPRRVFENLGGLDNRFGDQGLAMDLCWRARDKRNWICTSLRLPLG